MKILHVIDKMDPRRGGVCQAVRTIIAGLDELGILNEVVCLDSPGMDFLSHNKFRIYALGPSNNNWSFTKKLIPWLLNHLCDFDAVIVHGLWQYPTYALNRVKKQLEKKISNKRNLPKLYVMPHGMLDPYFQKATGRKFKAIRNIIYWKLLEKKAVNEADGLLFTCEAERLLARVPFKPYHPKQEIIVGLGVEIPPSYLEEMKKAFLLQCENITDQNYFLFLSRIHEKKGVDILLEAYKKLKEEKINDAARDGKKGISPKLPKLVIAGPGLETEYGKKIKNLVVNSPVLSEDVIFTGMLRGNAKWGAFYGCEAFLLPSHQENFGIAIVEAMACGKPVLITDKVNIWREIKSAGAGLISGDTLDEVYVSLKYWNKMEKPEQLDMARKAVKCFDEKFAVSLASKRLMKALSA